MQEHYDNPGTGATAESTLDELFGTLWAISVITRRMAGQINAMRQKKGDRRMAGQINAMRQKKGEPKHEQNVGTVHRRRRAAQMW